MPKDGISPQAIPYFPGRQRKRVFLRERIDLERNHQWQARRPDHSEGVRALAAKQKEVEPAIADGAVSATQAEDAEIVSDSTGETPPENNRAGLKFQTSTSSTSSSVAATTTASEAAAGSIATSEAAAAPSHRGADVAVHGGVELGAGVVGIAPEVAIGVDRDRVHCYAAVTSCFESVPSLISLVVHYCAPGRERDERAPPEEERDADCNGQFRVNVCVRRCGDDHRGRHEEPHDWEVLGAAVECSKACWRRRALCDLDEDNTEKQDRTSGNRDDGPRVDLVVRTIVVDPAPAHACDI